MYPEFVIPPDQYRAFNEDLKGAVIGRKLANKYGWKVGDHFFLESFIPPYRKKDGPFEFQVDAIFDTDPVKHPNTDTNLMLFHFKYLYEATGRRIAAGPTRSRSTMPPRPEPEQGHRRPVREQRRPDPHRDEQAFTASFIAMAGNLAFLLNSIGLAVSFTILLVTANTMSMAVRERRTEIAVLKTLASPACRSWAHRGGGHRPGRHRGRLGPRRQPGADVVPLHTPDQGHAGRHRPERAAPQAR
jgi:putative ABC transport system permease protein